MTMNWACAIAFLAVIPVIVAQTACAAPSIQYCLTCALTYPDGCNQTPDGAGCMPVSTSMGGVNTTTNIIPCDASALYAQQGSLTCSNGTWVGNGYCANFLFTSQTKWKGEYTVGIVLGIVGFLVICGVFFAIIVSAKNYNVAKQEQARLLTSDEDSTASGSVLSSDGVASAVPDVPAPANFMVPPEYHTPGGGAWRACLL